ncbi:uncharacterized protein LOC119066151 [Bradysia coprophila]|uniref:uncharacterized protein LOC119066151 n=1 Tax=Bradysia coprophila TaxID=38358 RepID=UPI00187DBFC8|nr:uncharacterized protein LOC119066151 [Bradysia coprophila]
MHQSLFLFIFAFLSVASSTRYESKLTQYSVPKATVTAYQSKGFSVSIPDSPGLSLFAFHGNVNSKLDMLDGGSLSKDITKPKNGMWTYTDVSIKLKIGDTINYWLYVVKDGLGYRLDQQQFVVKELFNDDIYSNIAEVVVVDNPNSNCNPSTILAGDIHHHHHHYSETSQTTSQCPSDNKSNEFFEKITKQLNVVLMQLQSLHDKTAPLTNKINSLEEVIGELLKDKDNGTKLLLIGTNPPQDSNAYEAIRGVITDRLDLNDLSASIKFAEILKEGGIMFEVKTSIEKHRILIRAQERFNTDKRKIVNFGYNDKSKPNSEVPDIFHRTGDTEKSMEETQTDVGDRFVFE